MVPDETVVDRGDRDTFSVHCFDELAGHAAFVSADEAAAAFTELGGDLAVVKAQIHAGGRGKAGGVKLARTLDEVREYADGMLGIQLVTHQSGPEGLPAGDIAEQLQSRQNTMSSHLAKLHRAGIVKSQRDGRHIIYRADFDAVSSLILYLMEDCCGRSAQLCDPIAASINY